MNPFRYIRKELFKVSQSEFAEIAGTTQASVSRWETGSSQPGHGEMERIRNAAIALNLEWATDLFFEVPVKEVAA